MGTKDIIQKDWRIDLQSNAIKAIVGNFEEKLTAFLEFDKQFNEVVPVSLYKYFSDKLEKLNDVKNNKLWYSAPCEFNDVFDSDIAVDDEALFQEVLKMALPNQSVKKGSKKWIEIREGFKSRLKVLLKEIDKVKTTTGVVCLSENNDSLLMWAHYANNHKGMCVEYNLVKIVKELRFALIPVVYSNKKVILNKLNPQTYKEDSHAIVIESLTSKSLEWSYENEWRIIRDKEACGELWKDEKKGALLSMIKPKSITLGCEASGNFETEVIKYCIESNINLYKMEKDKNKYKLNKKSIVEFN